MINKKKKGFTLAEVLITLGIIGVVAALTAPALIQHAASAKTGPAMSRAISTLSNGFQTFLVEADANTIIAADPTIKSKPVSIFQTLADKYIKMKLFDDITAPAIKKSVVGEDELAAGSTMFMFGDRSAIFVDNSTECNPVTTTLATGETTTGCKFYFLPMGWMNKDILIVGEDAFELAYDNSGNILIYGLDYGTNWSDNCTDTMVKSFTPASDKKSCGGRIAAMGFKKDY